MSSLLELIDPEEAVVDFHGLRFDHTHAEATRQAVDVSSMSADFVILTTKPNYHGNAHQITESKLGKGMQTERHEANPVVYLEHGFCGLQFPAIGMSKDKSGRYTVKKQKNQATATVFFSQANPDAATVFAMVEEGVLHMASIGFDAKLGIRMKQEKPKALAEGVEELCWNCRGYLFTETELVEWSIVAQGADAGAVRQYLDRGKVGTEKLTDPMREYLQALAPKVAWSPGFSGFLQTEEQPESKPPVVDVSLPYGVVVSSEDPEAVKRAIQALEKQSALDAKPAGNTLPASTEGAASSGMALPSSAPAVDLAKEWEQREAAKSQQSLQEALVGAVGDILDKKFGELADGQQRIEDELKRRIGVID